MHDVKEAPAQMDKFELQRDQYKFPYHYVPHLDENGVGTRFRSAAWGLEYLCYQLHVQELILSRNPSSVLDVGCGDGFLVKLLKDKISRLVGVDLAAEAIAFARAFNPEVELHLKDAADLDEQFDVVTAVEVLEHIPDDETSHFLRGLASRTRVGGHVVLSVPTTVTPVEEKHYRHYTIELLQEELEASGAPLEIQQVDYVYRRLWVTQQYLKWTNNRYWMAELHLLRRAAWKWVWEVCRHADAGNGRHLVVVLKKHS